MKLEPVNARTKPGYPAHRRRSTGFGAWAKRAAAAGFASCALALGGCYGASPYEREDPPSETDDDDPVTDTDDPTEDVPAPQPDDPPPTTEPDPDDDVEIPPVSPVPEDIAGGMRAPGFECGAAPDWYDIYAPSYIEGSLCAEETSWARLLVEAPMDALVSFVTGSDMATVTLVAPDGTELAELGPEQVTVELHLAAGEYLLAATPLDPLTNPYAWIAVQVDAL